MPNTQTEDYCGPPSVCLSLENDLATSLTVQRLLTLATRVGVPPAIDEIVARAAAEIIPASPPFDHILAAVARNRVRPTPVFDNVFARPGRPRPLPRACLCPRHAALLRFRRSKGLQLANGPV